MKPWISRLFLAVAAAIFAIGGGLHAVAYLTSASPRIDGANVKGLFGAQLKVLWLADSTTLLALALLFGFIAARPNSISRPALLMVAVVPAATTALLYVFLGPFYAAHLLLLATALVVAAGLIAAPRQMLVASARTKQS
jgi:hypothetical protein